MLLIWQRWTDSWEQQQITNSTKLRTFQTCVILTFFFLHFEQVINLKIKFWPKNVRFYFSCNFQTVPMIALLKTWRNIVLDLTSYYGRVKIFHAKLILGNRWLKEKLAKSLIVKTGVETEKEPELSDFKLKDFA